MRWAPELVHDSKQIVHTCPSSPSGSSLESIQREETPLKHFHLFLPNSGSFFFLLVPLLAALLEGDVMSGGVVFSTSESGSIVVGAGEDEGTGDDVEVAGAVDIVGKLT